MALATAAELANRLGVTFTASETTDATSLIELAGEVIKSEAGQEIEAVTADALTRPGSWDARLRLPERPVTDIDSVTLDGTALTEGDEFYLDGDEIVRTSPSAESNFDDVWGSAWGGPEATLVITYDHGYAAGEIPGLVKALCLEVCLRVWTNPGSVRSEQYGNESVSYADSPGLMLSEGERKALRRAVGRTAGTIQTR